MPHILQAAMALCAALMLAATGRAGAQRIVFEPGKSLNLGVLAFDSQSTATFKVKNKSHAPLLLKDVRPGCDCLVTDWTREAIKPGGEGTISLTYDARLLGRFERDVAVFTNQSKEPIYLTLTGEVSTEARDAAADYPIAVGDLRLSTDNVEFDDVGKGDRPQAVIGIFNGGRTPYAPELMHLPQYLSATAQPATLRPGRAGRVVLTLNSEKLSDYGLTQTHIYLSRFVGDKVGIDNDISVSAILLPPATATTGPQPDMQIEQTTLNLGSFGNKGRLKGSVTLTNRGQAPLVVRSVQVMNSALNVDLKRRIPAGETAKLNLAVVKRFLARNKGRLAVLIITNDPQKPKTMIEVKVQP